MSTKRLALISGLAAVGLLAGCSQGGGTDDSSTPTAGQADSTPASGSQPSASQADIATVSALKEKTDLATTDVPTAPAKAVTIATDKAGSGTVYSIDLDFDRRYDTWEYEVEIQNDGVDHEVHVDAVSGKVLADNKERTDDKEHAVDPAKPLAVADAIKLAQDELKKSGGEGRLASWSLEYDDGAPLYSFEFGDDPKDVDVKVDAKTKRAFVDD